MGNLIFNYFQNWFPLSLKERRILMLGLDGGGKSTILYKLKMGETLNQVPTIGFNVEKVQHKNISFTVWDIGGQSVIRRCKLKIKTLTKIEG